ncbi:MAG TPA: ABC transporter ATP-binding protein [Longimicrobiales bacterium]|nr:ABC transporter ATP-binding protein [Longimicrobiales bacterium]
MRELRTLLPYFRPYKRGFVLGIACVVIANAFQLASPWLMKLVIDGLGEPGVTGARVALLGSLLVGAAVLSGFFRYAMRQLLNGISRHIEADLRNDFFRHLLGLDAHFYGRMRTGDLMSRATNDTFAVRQAAGPAVMYTTNTIVSFALALALMIWISPRLTLLAMIPMVALPLLVLGFGRVIHRRFEHIQEQFSALSTFVQESLTGVRIVRAYAQEEQQIREFEAYNDDYRRRNMRLAYTSGAFHPALGLLSGIAMVLVTWLGGLEVIAGNITTGDFVAFFFYLAMLIWPMIALGWVVNLFQRAAASMGRINEVLRAEPLVRVPAPPVPLDDVRGEIEFRDVSFAYPGTERRVLDRVSFVARPGETVAVVGPTGSGKSTLVSLLVRLYDPVEGSILLDGVPLTEVSPADLRARIGMVPQDSFLFSDTIAANIGLGLPAPASADGEGPADAVVRAAAVAQLADQIEAFPEGYRTMLGERGINLSGGQKQRAALARALARDPAVVVLDDALSAVDTHTEAAILDELRGALRGRTTFIISHRVSAVMNADQILVLEDGRIVERGRHADLIAAGGTYARLLRRQLLEEGLEEGDAASAERAYEAAGASASSISGNPSARAT